MTDFYRNGMRVTETGELYTVSGDVGNIETLLDAVTATGAGTTFTVTRLARAFQVVMSADDATCKLQASIDNATWIDLRTSTASEGFSTAEPWPYVRGNVTSYGSGTVTLLMATD